MTSYDKRVHHRDRDLTNSQNDRLVYAQTIESQINHEIFSKTKKKKNISLISLMIKRDHQPLDLSLNNQKDKLLNWINGRV